MNTRGHKQTLVPAHPGNKNAVKSGVYSRAALAPRVAELDAQLAGHPADEVAEETLRGNLSSLMATREAMDEELAKRLVGRRGEPRTLLDHYLRLTDKILRNAVALAAVAERRQPTLVIPREQASREEAPQEPLHEAVARAHYRNTLAHVTPEYFDPERFLQCVIDADDPMVTMHDRTKALKLLASVEAQRSTICACRTSMTARDAIEMRDWIDESREETDVLKETDEALAARVRTIARGEAGDLYAYHRHTIEAVQAVMALAAEAAEGADSTASRPLKRGHAPFWREILSPDPTVRPKSRLQALAALHDAGAIKSCTCPGLESAALVELQADLARALIVRAVAQKNRHAASIIALFPATYVACREINDAARVAAEPKLETLEA